MSASEREFAQQRPASHLKRGWHVEFAGRWWLVESADPDGPLVNVTLSERVGVASQETTRFGARTPLWSRDVAEQILFTVADERRRREEILDAHVERLGAAFMFRTVVAA